MIKTFLYVISGDGFSTKALNDKLNEFLGQGLVPISSCHVPSSDGPGGILYTLGQVADGDSVAPHVSTGNGSTDTLPVAEVVEQQ